VSPLKGLALLIGKGSPSSGRKAGVPGGHHGRTFLTARPIASFAQFRATPLRRSSISFQPRRYRCRKLSQPLLRLRQNTQSPHVIRAHFEGLLGQRLRQFIFVSIEGEFGARSPEDVTDVKVVLRKARKLTSPPRLKALVNRCIARLARQVGLPANGVELVMAKEIWPTLCHDSAPPANRDG
jgi:hypothetical protein